jgi:hypothetical protein
MGGSNEPQNKFADLLRNVSADQRGEVVESLLALLKPTLESSIIGSIDKVYEQALHRIGYTEEVAGLVQLLSARSNDSKEDVLKKALMLYGLALDAREKNNKIAILTPDDVVVRDIIGFEPVGAGS